MSSPEEIQQDIERTRSQLSNDVDRLTEKVTPGKVIGRQVDTVKSRANSLKDRVMGSSDDSSGLHGAGDALSSKTSALGDKAVRPRVESIGRDQRGGQCACRRCVVRRRATRLPSA